MSIPRFDYNLNVGVVRGKFDEVGGAGWTGEVVANGFGGTAVFAVADPEFL